MIVGSMALQSGRVALYRFKELYATAPIDMLFGKGVELDSLNARSITRALDILFNVDLEKLSWECAERCCETYGLSTSIYHMDATNVSVYAILEDASETDAPVARFGGNSKINRNDLRQYNAMGITDGNRVLRYLKAYSGNTSDVIMDAEALNFLLERVDPKTSVCIADCKLVTKDLVSLLCSSGIGFISKCPSGFSDKVRDEIIYSIESSYFDDSNLGDGYGTYDTDADTVCGKLRFIGFKTPKDKKHQLQYYRTRGEELLTKAFAKVRRAKYGCSGDASMAAEAAIASVGDMGYKVQYSVLEMERPLKRKGRGRPSKDAPPQPKEKYWVVEASWEFDEEVASELAVDDEIQVIVTNISRSPNDTGNIRFGANPDTVVRSYLDEYKAEHIFRLLKSGIGMDKVYLHKGSRVAAMFFIAGIAGTLLSVMDEMLRRGNAGTTTNMMKLSLLDTTVRIKRSTGYKYIDGHSGSGAEIEKYCQILDLDPELLLGRS